MTQPIAFTNAQLFDGKGASHPGSTVIVEEGKIRGVGRGEAPSHARTIDLAGRTLMPGMTVGHWHGEYVDIGPPRFGPDLAGIFIGTEEPPVILALQAVDALKTALASGVTRVVSGASSHDIDKQLKMAMERGMFDGPHLTPCSRHIVSTGDYEDRGNWWVEFSQPTNEIRRIGGNVFVDGPEQVMKAVRQEILRGAEIIKILPTGGHGINMQYEYRGLSRAELEALVNTAHERGVRVRAHTVSAAAVLECIAAGVDIIDHADELDEACVEAMVKAGTFWIPSMLFSKVISYGGVGEPQPGKYADEIWDTLAAKLKMANDAGVLIVPGDDFGAVGLQHAPGVYARELMVYTDDMGMAPAEVLRWATSNGAKLGLAESRSGSIEEGKDADLLILDADPTKDISILTDPARYLRATMLGGRFVKNELGAEQASARALAAE